MKVDTTPAPITMDLVGKSRQFDEKQNHDIESPALAGTILSSSSPQSLFQPAPVGPSGRAPGTPASGTASGPTGLSGGLSEDLDAESEMSSEDNDHGSISEISISQPKSTCTSSISNNSNSNTSSSDTTNSDGSSRSKVSLVDENEYLKSELNEMKRMMNYWKTKASKLEQQEEQTGSAEEPLLKRQEQPEQKQQHNEKQQQQQQKQQNQQQQKRREGQQHLQQQLQQQKQNNQQSQLAQQTQKQQISIQQSAPSQGKSVAAGTGTTSGGGGGGGWRSGLSRFGLNLSPGRNHNGNNHHYHQQLSMDDSIDNNMSLNTDSKNKKAKNNNRHHTRKVTTTQRDDEESNFVDLSILKDHPNLHHRKYPHYPSRGLSKDSNGDKHNDTTRTTPLSLDEETSFLLSASNNNTGAADDVLASSTSENKNNDENNNEDDNNNSGEIEHFEDEERDIEDYDIPTAGGRNTKRKENNTYMQVEGSEEQIEGGEENIDGGSNVDDNFDGDMSFCQALQSRSGWLVGLLVLQSMSSFILKNNEKLLQRHTVIVQFLTMLVGAGGNAGNQASVRVIRGLATGQINKDNLRSYLLNELRTAILLSTILGIAGCVRALVFMVPLKETIAITSSLVSIVIISVVIGTLLPLSMDFVGIDPAHSSTTIQVVMDILGVMITVGVSGAILH